MYQLNGNEKRPNASNLLVKSCITTALFSLLEKKPLSDISITEIVNRAGVSRMGFYRNFSSKEDIIEKYIFDCFFETVDEIERNKLMNSQLTYIIETTLSIFQKYANQIMLLQDRNLDNLVLRSYEKAYYDFYRVKKNSRIHEYSTKMFISEVFNLEMVWVRNGMVETPKQLAKIYYKILSLRVNSEKK